MTNTRITQHRHWIGVGLFSITCLFSLTFILLEKKYFLLAPLGCLISFFVYMILDRLDQVASLERVEEQLGSLLPLSILARCVGNERSSELLRLPPNEASSYTERRIMSAARMYNTSFMTGDSVSSSAYSRWLQIIAQCVYERECVIEEVIASNERLQIVRGAIATHGKKPRGEYKAYLAEAVSNDTRSPYMEICIFEDRNGTLEVLFGWSSDPTHYLGEDVYLSRNEHVARFFLNYFRRLQAHPHSAPPPR